MAEQPEKMVFVDMQTTGYNPQAGHVILSLGVSLWEGCRLMEHRIFRFEYLSDNVLDFEPCRKLHRDHPRAWDNLWVGEKLSPAKGIAAFVEFVLQFSETAPVVVYRKASKWKFIANYLAKYLPIALPIIEKRVVDLSDLLSQQYVDYSVGSWQGSLSLVSIANANAEQAIATAKQKSVRLESIPDKDSIIWAEIYFHARYLLGMKTPSWLLGRYQKAVGS